MKFFLVDSKHNFFHWLVAVATRVLISLIQVPIATYVAALGFSTSARTLWPVLPQQFALQISSLINLLPYYKVIKRAVFILLDPLLKAAPTWWAMVIGFPLILLGISVILVNFFELYYTLFSRLHNQARCPFCKRAVKINIDGTY